MNPRFQPARRSVLALLGAAPLLAGASHANAGTIPRDLLPGGAFDDFVAARAAVGQFSGTVLLAHRGRPVLSRTHGMSNVDKLVPNGPETRFCLSSITKTFTAVAILQLVAARRVSLRAKLGAYVDGFPPEIADRVTIHHLLTHTSLVGRPPINPPPVPGRDSWDDVREAWEATLNFIRGLQPDPAPPGSEYRYGNDGYFVLGAVVEAASGVPYYDYVRDNVFRAARMTDTRFDTRPDVLADDRIARPYWTQQSTGERVDFTTHEGFPFVGDPATGAYTTAADLLRFGGALWDGTLLDRAYTELLAGGKVPTDPADHGTSLDYLTHYCYGHIATIANGRRIAGHSGSGPGMANNVDVYPDLDWVTIVLSNYDTTVKPIVEESRRLITESH